MVREEGLEPSRLSTYAPQTYVSTNSTTRAIGTIRDEVPLNLVFELLSNPAEIQLKSRAVADSQRIRGEFFGISSKNSYGISKILKFMFYFNKLV